LVSKVTASKKAQEVSYLAAQFDAQKQKNHTSGEHLTTPVHKIIVAKMLQQAYSKMRCCGFLNSDHGMTYYTRYRKMAAPHYVSTGVSPDDS
jgi:predicted PolB exonuclease-like 3'-5' exonuclease